MAWTVETLKAYRKYPRPDAVIARALELAEADCDRINSSLIHTDPARRDRAVDQLVEIDLKEPDYSGNVDGGILVNSRNDARNRILLQLVGAGQAVDDGRERSLFPPRFIGG